MIYLTLLFIKHYYVDFVLQTEEMVKGKGIYMNLSGLHHSVQHALFTMILTMIFIPDVAIAAVFAFFDFFVHYHTDWVKMRFGTRDVTTPAFWNQLGLDQLSHSLTYVIMATVMMLL
jgi:hypothetical protein